MTLPSTPRRAGPYVGNLVTTSFPFGFKAFSPGDVTVVRRIGDSETILTYGVNYGVTLNTDQDQFPGGYVLYPVGDDPMPASESITIISSIPYNQQTKLPSGGQFRPQVVENAFDRIVAQIQQLAEQNARQVGMPVSYNGSELKLPFPQPGKLLAWNNGGNGLVNVDADVLVNVAGFTTWRTQRFTGGGSSFTLSQAPASVKSLLVAVDGLLLDGEDGDFSLSGTTLSITGGTPSGSKVFVRWGEALPETNFDSSNVAFNAGVTGSATTDIFELLMAHPSAAMIGGLDRTGATDSSAAVTAALDAFGECRLPAGVFRLSNVQYKSGQRIVGAGVRHKGYYDGTFSAFTGGTVILVPAGQTAFTTGGVNCVGAEIAGMSFHVVGNNSTSAYGAAPAFSAGTVAIDETGAKECDFHDLSFFNFENCFLSRSINGQGAQYTCRNHHHSIHSVNDCKHLIECEDTAGGTKSGHADLHLYDMNGLIHLGTAFLLIDVDGTTIDNVTVYQCHERQIEAHGCQFLRINGTFFENGLGNVLVDGCQDVTLAGKYSRAGWYTNSVSSGILINDCDGVEVRASVERPKGFGVNAIGGNNYIIDVNVVDPMNGTGNGNAVMLSGVDTARVSGTSRVLTTSSFAVNADDTCKNISGLVSSDGMTAGPHLDLLASGEVLLRSIKPASGVAVSAGGSAEVTRRQIGVPPGKSIVMNYATWNLAAGLRLRVIGYFSPTPTVGTDFVGATLHTNGTGSTELVDVIAYVNNPTGAPINTGASDEFSIKFKVV